MTTAFDHCDTGTPLLVNGNLVGYWEMVSHCCPFNLAGNPAIVLPLSQDQNNMPIGVQIIGRRWGEEQLLSVASTFSQITGGYQQPPGFEVSAPTQAADPAPANSENLIIRPVV